MNLKHSVFCLNSSLLIEAFSLFIIKDCCSPVESVAATGQALPTLRDDLETLIRRELPRVKVHIDDTLYDRANPGKAFENTKQKMV